MQKTNRNFVRRTHLSVSYWLFVLAGFVLLENVLMLLFWVFAGWQIMILLQRSVNQEKKKKRML